MQAFAQSYRGISLLLQLGADRIFVPLAITSNDAAQRWLRHHLVAAAVRDGD